MREICTPEKPDGHPRMHPSVDRTQSFFLRHVRMGPVEQQELTQLSEGPVEDFLSLPCISSRQIPASSGLARWPEARQR